MLLRHGAGLLRVHRVVLASLAVATVVGCSAGAAERRGVGRTRDRFAPTDEAMPREAAPRVPDATTGTASPPLLAPPPAALVPADPLGIPAPPRGSVTSDTGGRMARPTPIGQLAPEEPPPDEPPAR
jgi:hypothetical protein